MFAQSFCISAHLCENGGSVIGFSSLPCHSGVLVSLLFSRFTSSLTVRTHVFVSYRPHVDVKKLSRNTKVVAEALARVIYNLTEKVNTQMEKMYRQ